VVERPRKEEEEEILEAEPTRTRHAGAAAAAAARALAALLVSCVCACGENVLSMCVCARVEGTSGCGPDLVDSEGVEAIREGGHGAVDPERCGEGRTE
jgi:hypothetical protein